MKQLYPFRKRKTFTFLKIATLTVAPLFVTMISFSQGLTFTNPTLQSGTAGSDGAVYRFPNVMSNVDALVTINGRSSTLVTLDTIDVTSTGWDKAFQPVVTYNKGNVKGPISWWMEFQVTFVQSGTSTTVLQDTLNATAIDVDGDGGSLQEQFSAFGSATYALNTPSSLSVTSISGGSVFTGPTTNSAGIDTNATKVMVTLNYSQVSSIKFRYGGAITGNNSSSSGNRYNSIWFKTFQYTAARINTLPVQIASFNATLSNGNNKALLNWATSSEVNASHFVIQRSADATNYDDIAMVFAQEGNSNSLRQYSYSDNIGSLKSPLIYYRLKIVDIDGNFKYSDVEIIKSAEEERKSGIVVYPNPSQSELRITIPDNWQGRAVSYNIYNIHGSLLKQKTSSNAGQTVLMNISDLPMGIYVVKAANGNETSTQRIVKLNN
jgi:hypothetical protein